METRTAETIRIGGRNFKPTVDSGRIKTAYTKVQ